MKARLARLVLFFLLLSPFVIFSPAKAQDAQKLEELTKQIEEYTSKIQELQTRAGTLSNQIAQFDAQIHLTELKINQTQEQIVLLGGRIDQLTSSLTDLESAFESRAIETYKLTRINKNGLLLLSAPGINEAVSRYHYLQKIQEADRNLLERLQSAQQAYQTQKGELEDLEKVLGTQKEQLDSQKTAKGHLLTATKNDEKKYQQLLAQSKAEYEAIQAIIAGRGDETEVGKVSQGQRIASVIQGPSCNSNGAHLHFIVSNNGAVQNPFSYLKPIEHENCSGGGECSPGDPFNPSGSWEWPLNPPIEFSQGYGYTWAVQNTWVGRIYQFHNGIDIDNPSNSTVKAVAGGTLYQGSYTGVAGCRLRYVRVDHEGSDIDTFYLHINY